MSENQIKFPLHLATDAQGPNGIMDDSGKAVAMFTDTFAPVNGYCWHPEEKPSPEPTTANGTGYYPQRSACVRAVMELLNRTQPESLWCAVCNRTAKAPHPHPLSKVATSPPSKFVVHREPEDMRKDPAESCVDCKQPTRFWLPDQHTPLCEDCCEKRNNPKFNRNTLREREWAFEHAVLAARDRLNAIATGQVERGRRVSQYDHKPGMRPLKAKEAMEVAKHTIDCLNAAVNAFQASAPQPWDWERFENKD